MPVLVCRDLEKLELQGIHGFENLEFLKNLSALLHLDVSESGVRNLRGLRHLSSLEILKLKGSDLETVGCESYEGLLTELDFSDCSWLFNVDGLGNIKNLETVNLTQCSQLKSLKGLRNLNMMQSLDLTGCKSLVNLDGLENQPQLRYVKVDRCVSLNNIDALQATTKLRTFDWINCPLLETKEVEELLVKFPNLDEWPDVTNRHGTRKP